VRKHLGAIQTCVKIFASFFRSATNLNATQLFLPNSSHAIPHRIESALGFTSQISLGLIEADE
jgi:hypothetical protein